MCDPTTGITPDDGDTQTTTTTTTTKQITKSELSQHNTPTNAWCAIHNQVLDISSFAKRHPGGDVILLAAGRDATILFETYHPRGVPDDIVRKLTIGTMEEESAFRSFYSWDSEFYKTMKRRVIARLEERNLRRRGGWEIWLKALGLVIGFWYCMIRMYVAPTFSEGAVYAASMGAFASFIGTCIQHDGNHGAFAVSRRWNKVAGWTLDMIGASAFTWELQHMLGHHPYTNLLDVKEESGKERGVDCPLEEKNQESDPDVFSSFPAMRMHPHHKPQWYHRYQHLYAPLLFSLMTLSKVFQQDIEVISQNRLYHIDATCRYHSKFNRMRFWFMKALTFLYMMVLPCYFHGVGKGLALFVIGHMTCGQILATMFIVNHIIEGVSFAQNDDTRPKTVQGTTASQTTPSKSHTAVPPNDWAAVQCQTSVNWSPGSWFWNHFSGGLSHQIEHHLFPSLCHTNYVFIQDVVEGTCREFGVPYRSEVNLGVAYWKMLRHLKFLGDEVGGGGKTV